MKDAGLDAIPFFPVNTTRFTAHVIAHTSGGHEIPFIGCVDEYCAGKGLSRKRLDGGNPTFFHGNTVLTVQPFIAENLEFIFFYQILKDMFGRVGLEDPHRPVFTIYSGGALSFVSVLRLFLPSPRAGLVVMKV